VKATLERPGFYPVGGGLFTVEIEPTSSLKAVEVTDRGAILGRSGLVAVANLSPKIARRELRTCADTLGWERREFTLEQWDHARGPGNVVLVEVRSEGLTEVFSGFGRKGIKAEQVAIDVAEEVQSYLDLGVPVGEHLADQLVLVMALAGKGRFRTGPLSGHTRTQLELIPEFLDLRCEASLQPDGAWMVTVS
jgi:RNA 3'-terminal phosphate cyclase (ATP)